MQLTSKISSLRYACEEMPTIADDEHSDISNTSCVLQAQCRFSSNVHSRAGWTGALQRLCKFGRRSQANLARSLRNHTFLRCLWCYLYLCLRWQLPLPENEGDSLIFGVFYAYSMDLFICEAFQQRETSQRLNGVCLNSARRVYHLNGICMKPRSPECISCDFPTAKSGHRSRPVISLFLPISAS